MVVLGGSAVSVSYERGTPVTLILMMTDGRDVRVRDAQGLLGHRRDPRVPE